MLLELAAAAAAEELLAAAAAPDDALPDGPLPPDEGAIGDELPLASFDDAIRDELVELELGTLACRVIACFVI